MQLLTHSRQDTFKTCRKKHWFAYELAIRSKLDAKPLRMGSAYHIGLEMLAKGDSIGNVVSEIRDFYLNVPESFDRLEWDYECETVVRLLGGYDWYWANSDIKHIESEFKFDIPLRNPRTGADTPIFNLAGKIDGIVQLPDGRIAVKESKLISEDLSDDSPLWKRLHIDHQVSLYVTSARRMGYDISSVVYDATRKPTISPVSIAQKDDLGVKIVVDSNGVRVRNQNGKFRQTPSKEDGFVLLSRPMTVEEWGDKLTNDISERPEFYYKRKEIPRLDDDLRQYEQELWSIQKSVRDAQKKGYHFRTCNKNTCAYCAYFELCTVNYQPGDPLPETFVQLSYPHPELEELKGSPDASDQTQADPTEAGETTTAKEIDIPF